MIDYELAKQLKDAGFKFRSTDYACWDKNTQEGHCAYCGLPAARFFDEDVYEQHLMLPTLSELIEACGEEFKHLTRHKHLAKGRPDRTWSAKLYQGPVIYGKTPYEAVARLWLELQK